MRRLLISVLILAASPLLAVGLLLVAIGCAVLYPVVR